VASIARPGGNVTGLTYLVGQLSQKRLGLLKETLPSLTRVAVLQEGDRPGIARDFQDMESAAQLLRVELQRLDVYDPGEFDAAFEAATAARADCLLLGGGGFFVPHRARLVELAAQHRLPAMYFTPTFVHVGGLMAYASDIAGQYRRAAYYVDRILKGTKPADLPVEQPMVFDFAINLRTAQALGLTIPHHVLLQATEVIQ
jgi:putative ABC transport system substrate-binding protein